MVSEEIYVEKGRGICYICEKKIDEDIYLNGIDKHYYCSEEHAINGKNKFLDEKRKRKVKTINEDLLYEEKIKREIKVALKKGFKPAKCVTIFKATTEIWDTNPKNLHRENFIDDLKMSGSFETIAILKNLVGKTISIGKKQEIICKYTQEGIKNEFSILIILDYPKRIDFVNFDKYKKNYHPRIPLIIFNTSPLGHVIITQDTNIKIVHNSPDALIKPVNRFSGIKKQKQIKSWLDFSDEIRNYKKIHLFIGERSDTPSNKRIIETIYYTNKKYFIIKKSIPSKL